MNGQYFIEYGYALRVNQREAEAEEAYKSALTYAEFEDADDREKSVRAAAQRGIGYLLVEKGDFKGAEKAYKRSLKDDPDSPVAKSELAFIAEKMRR
jgi:tetratricopeptide (TPR) repeat protein